MTRTSIALPIRLVLPFVALLLVSSVSKPAEASSCGSDLIGCFSRAGAIDNWFDRWVAGLECELAYADCVGDALAR